MAQPRRSLELVKDEQRLLGDRIRGLTDAQMNQPSNLPGWSVLDLAVHITRVCDSIQLAVQRAAVGDDTPAFGPAVAKPREVEIRAMPRAEWVELQREAVARIADLVSNLDDDQLEHCRFPHPQGLRSIRWFCTQLLAEVAFHRWDLDWSLGSRAPLEDGLAAYLLPFLLDPVEPLFGWLRTESGTQTFGLATDQLGWVLASTMDGTVVDNTSEPPTPLIRSTPGWLALAVYGRIRIDLSEFEISGPPETADRFAAIFGPHA